MRATSEDTRRTLVQTSGDLLDYEFFRILTVNIELAENVVTSGIGLVRFGDAPAQLRVVEGGAHNGSLDCGWLECG